MTDTPRLSARKNDAVVARVDGRPIYASDIAALMRSGRTRKQALGAAIRRELLAMEAERRGLLQRPEVRQSWRGALAEQLIYDAFGASYTTATIPRPLVEKAFQLNKRRFQHPELVDVTHVLAVWNKRMAPALEARALAAAQEVHKRATEKKIDAKTFAAIGEDLKKSARPVEIKVETLRTPQRGYTVKAFADAAFALKSEGDISPVVQTRFGYHVIYLRERIPAKHQTLEQVEEQVRENIFDDARRVSFDRFARTLERAHAATIDAQALRRALRQGE